MHHRESSVLPSTLLLAAGILAAACASSGSSRGKHGPPTQVSWLAYKSGQTISLVNDSHTDRLELYSQPRERAGPKVTTDEVMASLVEYLEEQGFDGYARSGAAPAGGDGRHGQALELRIGDRVSHMLVESSTPEKERRAFSACTEALVTVWNLTYQGQAVENEGGRAIFDQPGTRIHNKSQ